MNKQNTTYYDILGVDKTASKREIKQAYRKLVVLYHPDRIGNTEENREHFFKIQKAYDTLYDSELRKEYDSKLRGFTAPQTGATSTRTYNDVINALATLEAQIIANEWLRMSKSDQKTVHTAFGMAREMYYEKELSSYGHCTNIAARLIKKIVATQKEINRNEEVADYLDRFADSVLAKDTPPEYVSSRQKRNQKIIRVAFIAAMAVILAYGAKRTYQSFTEEVAETPREKVKVDSAEAIPYVETENNVAKESNTDKNNKESEEVGRDDYDRDSIMLKDSGIYDY